MSRHFKRATAVLLALLVMVSASSTVFAHGLEGYAEYARKKLAATLGSDNIIDVSFAYNDGKDSDSDTIELNYLNTDMPTMTDFALSTSCEELQRLDGFAAYSYEMTGTRSGLLTINVMREAAEKAPQKLFIWYRKDCLGEVKLSAAIEENPEPEYSVKYMLQTLDGEYELSSTETLTGKKDTMVAITAISKEHDGFRFVSHKSNVEAMIPPGDGSMVIELFYDRERYTVSFDTNGRGEAPAAYEDVMYQATISEPTPPQADGYDFTGWYTEQQCEKLWDFEAQQVTADMTLYAGWKESAQQPSKAEVQRIEGKTRIETAIETSKAGWNSADTVVLANANSYADALAGATIAHANNAPILLTSGKTIEKDVKAELERLGAKKVYLLGGETVISAQLEKELEQLELTCARLAGKDRFGTAAAIAKQLAADSGSYSEAAFIVSGENFPDALSIVPVAAMSSSPVLFATANGAANEETKAFLTLSKAKNIFVIGGEKAISNEAMESLRIEGARLERYSGADRFETAARIAEVFAESFTGKGVAIATGTDFPDALAGGVYAAKHGYPMLLTAEEHTAALDSYVEKHQPEKAVVFGGSAAVSDKALGDLMSK